MRAWSVVALFISGASGEANRCAAGPEVVHAYGEDAHCSDSASLLQRKVMEHVEGESDAVTALLSASSTRRCEEGAYGSSDDCSISDWSGWGTCTKTCGTGVKERTRTVVSGTCESACLKEAETCNIDECNEEGPTATPSSLACGYVKNARTDEPVEGVQVKVNDASTSTDSSGHFCLNLASGDVTLTAEKEKFITKEVARTISAGGVGISTVFINPVGEPNDWRIVLEWGKKPIDLDAHTLIPGVCPGQYVFWDNKKCENHGVKAELDLDHCFPDGSCPHKHPEPTPETTTIANVDPNNCQSWGCKIFFCVQNYSGKMDEDKPPVNIMDSEAVVSVSHGGEEVATYNIKDGKGYTTQDDLTWHAFKIHADTGKVYPCSNGNCPCR